MAEKPEFYQLGDGIVGYVARNVGQLEGVAEALGIIPNDESGFKKMISDGAMVVTVARPRFGETGGKPRVVNVVNNVVLWGMSALQALAPVSLTTVPLTEGRLRFVRDDKFLKQQLRIEAGESGNKVTAGPKRERSKSVRKNRTMPVASDGYRYH